MLKVSIVLNSTKEVNFDDDENAQNPEQAGKKQLI
jgi:hypothetical protein